METRREIRTLSTSPKPLSEIKAWVGVTWAKECATKDKITSNVISNYKKSLKRFEEVVITEVIAASQGSCRLSLPGSTSLSD